MRKKIIVVNAIKANDTMRKIKTKFRVEHF